MFSTLDTIITIVGPSEVLLGMLKPNHIGLYEVLIRKAQGPAKLIPDVGIWTMLPEGAVKYVVETKFGWPIKITFKISPAVLVTQEAIVPKSIYREHVTPYPGGSLVDRQCRVPVEMCINGNALELFLIFSYSFSRLPAPLPQPPSRKQHWVESAIRYGAQRFRSRFLSADVEEDGAGFVALYLLMKLFGLI